MDYNSHLCTYNQCQFITDTILIPKKCLNFMYNVMEAKRLEVSALLRAGRKQTDIANQLNVSIE